MKLGRPPLIATLVAALTVMASACSQPNSTSSRSAAGSAPATGAAPVEDVAAVSPALERYRQQVVADDLWKRGSCRCATAAW